MADMIEDATAEDIKAFCQATQSVGHIYMDHHPFQLIKEGAKQSIGSSFLLPCWNRWRIPTI